MVNSNVIYFIISISFNNFNNNKFCVNIVQFIDQNFEMTSNISNIVSYIFIFKILI